VWGCFGIFRCAIGPRGGSTEIANCGDSNFSQDAKKVSLIPASDDLIQVLT
jgi:hypothetical protein